LEPTTRIVAGGIEVFFDAGISDGANADTLFDYRVWGSLCVGLDAGIVIIRCASDRSAVGESNDWGRVRRKASYQA
jgi:hypothetical protein